MRGNGSQSPISEQPARSPWSLFAKQSKAGYTFVTEF